MNKLKQGKLFAKPTGRKQKDLFAPLLSTHFQSPTNRDKFICGMGNTGTIGGVQAPATTNPDKVTCPHCWRGVKHRRVSGSSTRNAGRTHPSSEDDEEMKEAMKTKVNEFVDQFLEVAGERFSPDAHVIGGRLGYAGYQRLLAPPSSKVLLRGRDVHSTSSEHPFAPCGNCNRCQTCAPHKHEITKGPRDAFKPNIMSY